MSRVTWRVGAVLGVVAAGLAGGGAAPAPVVKDALQADTVWKGEIRQGGATFPATFRVAGRDKERVRGEIHFRAGESLNKLTFEGNVLPGGAVAWITDKKDGDVTYPGLYTGTLKGKTLSGNWQVPSFGQYDTFSVTLVE